MIHLVIEKGNTQVLEIYPLCHSKMAEKPPGNSTQLYHIAIPPNNTQTALNKIKRKKAPSSNHRLNDFPSIEYLHLRTEKGKETTISSILMQAAYTQSVCL